MDCLSYVPRSVLAVASNVPFKYVVRHITGATTDASSSTTDSRPSGPMNQFLKKKHVLCAGATGLWLLASKAHAHSHAATEKALANDEDALFGATKEESELNEDMVWRRSFSPAFSEESLQLTAEGIPECLTPMPSSSQQTSLSGAFVLTASNAMQQLEVVMPHYHENASYEDNFISLAGARCIFYHFLTLICMFFKVEIFVKNLKSEPAENKVTVYTAESLRRYVVHPLPFIHYLLPEVITCEVQTVCCVDDQRIRHHRDRYTKMNVSWKLKIPTLWHISKSLIGYLYTYLLNVIYFVLDLLHIALDRFHLEK